jgi:hypothetical protein
MRLGMKKAWLHWRRLGQGCELVKQAPEPRPRSTIPEQAFDQKSISATTSSQQGAIEVDHQAAITPVFINNGE